MPGPFPNDRFGARSSADFDEQLLVSPADEGALNAAVRATLAGAEGNARITEEEIAALSRVARRLGRVPLELDPVVIELVEAVIGVNYGHVQRSPEVWHGIAVKIAAVLFDSPTARLRLENLWRRLTENGPDARAPN
jgi:hypothetical protein